MVNLEQTANHAYVYPCAINYGPRLRKLALRWLHVGMISFAVSDALHSFPPVPSAVPVD